MKFPAFLAPLLACACGPALPGNSAYQGAWTVFAVNGATTLGGFDVDDHGRFQISLGSVQLSGAIAPDAAVSGSVSGVGGGICVLSGHCQSTNSCSGTTQGQACPADADGVPWTTFSLCRGNSC